MSTLPSPISTYTLILRDDDPTTAEVTNMAGLPAITADLGSPPYTQARVYLSREQARRLSDDLHRALADLRDADTYATNPKSDGPDGP